MFDSILMCCWSDDATIQARILRDARAESVRLGQGAMYEAFGVPDAYVAWSEFETPFTCRDLGCKEYGRTWKEMAMLRCHLNTQEHQVRVSDSH